MKKRLYKIEQGKKLDGVCGGIKENKYIVCHTGGITRYVKEIGNRK